MVKFCLPVFLRCGLMVKNLAFQFPYDSAFQIRPNSPVRPVFNDSAFRIRPSGFGLTAPPQFKMSHIYMHCNTEYILIIFDIQSYSFFGHMVFYLFGRLLNYSVVWFFIYSVFWILSN